MLRTTLIIGSILLVSFRVQGQFKLDNVASSMYLDGTSTLHDWTIVVEEMSGLLSAEVADNHISSIGSAQVIVLVKSMKSGKSGMDENIYKALQQEDFPKIHYKLKDYIVHNGTMTVKGELTIAGVTKAVETKVEHKILDGNVIIDGKLSFKMTDFEISPPEFLFGAFKTGDDIV
jgi:polyisoprenoid-binding protein YceI